MAEFIEITRLVKGKEAKITIAKNQIVSIRPDSGKTKITLTQLVGATSATITCPLSYELFIAQYKILK